jgi:hypothetical protein
VRGNKNGSMKDHGNLDLRIPPVVQVCRKVSASKAPTYQIYVPIPRDPAGKKAGRIFMLNSVVRLKELCYTVGDYNMFLVEDEVPDEDIAKTWQTDVTAMVLDFDEAVERPSDYVQSQEDQTPEIDIFGLASERAPAARSAERAQKAKQKEEKAKKGAGGTKIRTVRPNTAFNMAYQIAEPATSGEELSVSVPALSGAAQAAAHPSVKHITDTLVHMGHLEDLQKDVYLLSDPLGTERMGRRNRVAKHIKSKADAEEAMLVLCREGKVDLLSQRLFKVLHFEEDEEPSGQARTSSGSANHQSPKKKPKSVQAKPKVRRSVSSEPAKSANLYVAKIPKLRALSAGLPATQVANRETGVHKAPRIDNSGPNQAACLMNGKVLPVILLDYGAESVIKGRASTHQMGLRPSMMDLGAVALRVADGGTTRAFDRTKHSVEFVFNPKTPDETKVLSHVIMVNSEDADTLLGMSVLGKIGQPTRTKAM